MFLVSCRKKEKFAVNVISVSWDLGKTIVHEWAHYRWGVFDEFPTEDDATFYRHQNVWEATRLYFTFVTSLIERKNWHN